MQLILGSQSPRRKEILSRLGIQFSVKTADIDETLDPTLDIDAAIIQVARKKAQAISTHAAKNTVILAADTLVILDGQTLGKPADKVQAVQFLSRLSARTHAVKTAVCIFNVGTARMQTEIETSYVTFRKLTDDEIKDYVASGAPMDKAGAYGIQDEGRKFIEKLEGNIDNVMGLPCALVRKMLLNEGFEL